MKENERLTPFDRFRERHERIDGLCDWLEEHWEDVVLYSLSAAIFVLITIFVLIMCSACNETTPSMYPTSRSLRMGMPSMCPTSRSLLMGMPSMRFLCIRTREAAVFFVPPYSGGQAVMNRQTFILLTI